MTQKIYYRGVKHYEEPMFIWRMGTAYMLDMTGWSLDARFEKGEFKLEAVPVYQPLFEIRLEAGQFSFSFHYKEGRSWQLILQEAPPYFWAGFIDTRMEVEDES